MSTLDQPLDPAPMGRSDTELPRLKADFAESKKTVEEKHKDGWDKAGIVAQFLSGSVIALVGILAASYAQSADRREKQTEVTLAENQHAAQLRLSEQQSTAQMDLSDRQNKAQLALQMERDKADFDLENRKNFLAYLDKLTSASSSGRRTELLEQMEAALTPDEAVRIALDYAHAPYALGDPAVLKDDQKVFSRAILLAEHLKSSASSQLVQLRDSQIMPDKEVARGILGGPVRVFVRASSIDDFADMKLNGEPIGRRLTFLEDSGWIDITGRLRVGNAQASVNELTFVIINGPAGGYGGRFQISAGVQQYDTGPYSVNACPCNKEAFRVVAHLRLLPDHTAQLLDAVFTQGPY